MTGNYHIMEFLKLSEATHTFKENLHIMYKLYFVYCSHIHQKYIKYIMTNKNKMWLNKHTGCHLVSVARHCPSSCLTSRVHRREHCRQKDMHHHSHSPNTMPTADHTHSCVLYGYFLVGQFISILKSNYKLLAFTKTLWKVLKSCKFSNLLRISKKLRKVTRKKQVVKKTVSKLKKLVAVGKQ